MLQGGEGLQESLGSSPVSVHTAGAGPRLCASAGEWRPRDLCRRVGRCGPGPGFLLCSPPATQESGQSLTVRIRQLIRSILRSESCMQSQQL